MPGDRVALRTERDVCEQAWLFAAGGKWQAQSQVRGSARIQLGSSGSYQDILPLPPPPRGQGHL